MKKKVIVIVFTALLAISSVILFPTITSAPGGNYPPTRTISIGVVSSSFPGAVSNEDLYNGVVEPEINAYLEMLPGVGPPLQVDFLLRGPDEDEGWYTPERHLEEVQALAEDGVEFFIAGSWSSNFGGALEYIDQNDLFLVSSESTSPAFALPDNGFRLAPPDTTQAAVLNEMLLTYRDDQGIDALVVIQRDDVWGNGLVAAVADVYGVEGPDGQVVNMREIRYPDITTGFTVYLLEAEGMADDLVATYGADRVGVLVVAYDEGVDILQQAHNPDYDQLYDLSWFGTESMGRSQAVLENAGVEAGHVHLVSALGTDTDSEKYNDLADRYRQLGYVEASFYTATAVDAAWLIVNAWLDMEASTNAPFTGGDMAAIFADTAYGYYGYSGWTLLDGNGDRTEIDHDIWGFGPDEAGYPSIINYGRYNSISGEVYWEYEPPPWEADDCVTP